MRNGKANVGVGDAPARWWALCPRRKSRNETSQSQQCECILLAPPIRNLECLLLAPPSLGCIVGLWLSRGRRSSHRTADGGKQSSHSHFHSHSHAALTQRPSHLLFLFPSHRNAAFRPWVRPQLAFQSPRTAGRTSTLGFVAWPSRPTARSHTPATPAKQHQHPLPPPGLAPLHPSFPSSLFERSLPTPSLFPSLVFPFLSSTPLLLHASHHTHTQLSSSSSILILLLHLRSLLATCIPPSKPFHPSTTCDPVLAPARICRETGCCHHYTTTTHTYANINSTNEPYIANHPSYPLSPTPTLARQTISTIGL